MPEDRKFTLPRRLEVAQDFKTQGGLIAAILPIHYPRSLLRAFNILPMEVWGPPKVDPSFGAAHLQPYICSLVRNALSFFRSDISEVVDLIVVPHACDSLQGLASILLDFVGTGKPLLPLYIPRGQGKPVEEFFAEELRALYRQLEQITKRSPSAQALMQSIDREVQADGLLRELHSIRSHLSLSDFDYYRLIRTREFLPAEHFIEFADAQKGSPTAPPKERVRVLISGIVPEPMDLLHHIDAMGGLIAADDLACCGRRLYPAEVNCEDPFLRMARRIINGPPDWARGSSIQNRLDFLLRRIDHAGAEAVIFYNIKFCEPELFDTPDLRGALSQRGFPSIAIEMDLNDSLSDQSITRLEAFFEMIA